MEGNYRFIIKTVLDKAGIKEFESSLSKLNEKQKKLSGTTSKNTVVHAKYGKAIKHGNLVMREFTTTVHNSALGLQKITQIQQKTTQGWKNLSGSARTTSVSLKNLNSGLKGTTAGLLGAAKRALVVIPIWLALRAAMMSVVTSLKLGIEHIVSLDAALARAEAVARPITQSLGDFMDELKNKVQELARETGVSSEQIAELFYRMGTAGLSAEESIGGMEAALKTSIAIMGDGTETAKALADVYNLMGDRIEGATTPTEKMMKIGATIATLWEDNAFTLDEFTGSMKAFIPTAVTSNLTLDETLGLIASAATLMKRGAVSGTQLSRAFIFLSKNAEDVSRILGRVVNPKTANQYELLIEVITALNKQFKEGKNIAVDATKIFGVKGSDTVKALASNVDILTRNMEKLNNTTDPERQDNLNEKYKLQLETIRKQAERFTELRKQASAAFLIGITGGADMTEALQNVNKALEAMIPLIEAVGKGFSGISFLLGGHEIFDVLDDLKTVQIQGAAGAAIQFHEEYTRKLDELFKGGIIDKETYRKALEVMARTEKILLDPGFRGKNLDPLKVASAKKFQGEDFNVLKDINKLYRENAQVIEDTGKKIKENVDTEKEMVVEVEKEKEFRDKMLDSTKGQLVLADALKAAGHSELEILLRKVDIAEKQGDSDKERLAVLKHIIKEINKEAELMKSTIQGGIKDLLLGEGDVSDIFAGIGDRIKESMAEALSETITEEIFKATGLGEIFGEFIFGMKSAGDLMKDKEIEGHTAGAEIIYNRIIQAHIDGAAQTVTAAPGGAAGVGGGLGGLLSGAGKFQLIAPSGRPEGVEGPLLPGGGFDTAQGKFGVFSGGGLTAGGAAGAIGGAMALANLYKLQGTGDALGGLLQGASAGAAVGSLAGPIGTAIGAALGAAFGVYQATQSKTTEEISQTTKEIASKIKVTNNQLQVVNRNLVALRRELAFILPESAYFSESRNLTDNFSLHSRRGLV